MNKEILEKKFDGHTDAKLGTKKNPAVVSVQNKKRAKEIASLFEEKGWNYRIEVDSKKPEDISDLEILQHPTHTVILKDKIGRNDPCPCGSGQKYKKCHGVQAEVAVSKSPKNKETSKAAKITTKSTKITTKSVKATAKSTKSKKKK